MKLGLSLSMPAVAGRGATAPPTWVFFAGGQSNATSTWAAAIQAELRALAGHERIVVVNLSHIGRAIYNWISYPGLVRQTIYNEDLAAIDAGLAAQGASARLCGFFWMQGESDANVSPHTYYIECFNTMMGYLASDLSLAAAPNFCLGLSAFNDGAAYDTDGEIQAILGADYSHAKMNSLRSAQTTLGGQSDGSFADSLGMARSDVWHLTAPEWTALGGEMAAAWWTKFGNTIT